MSLATSLDGLPITQDRGLVWLLLSESGQIITEGGSSDQGGAVVGSATAGSALPCRIDAIGGGESERVAKVSERSTHVVTLTAETPVDVGQLISVGSRGTFEVTAVLARTHEWVRTIEVVSAA